MNRILQEDFIHIEERETDWELLKNSTVLVTGGSGFLGSVILKFLHYLNEKRRLNLTLYALIRDSRKAKQILQGCNVKLLIGDLCDSVTLPCKADYIIHCAAVTKSVQMIKEPVSVARGIVLGTDRILKLAYENQVKGMVYLSSMEVYGQTFSACLKETGETGRVTEEDLGYIDSMQIRSCYPLGKRMAENLCCGYYSQYGLPVKIARLAQVFGAGTLPGETRVFMQFAEAVMNKADIVLHTPGNSVGNYCYTADAVSGIFKLLFHGQNGEAYNIVNEQSTMTIREMAELAASLAASGEIRVRFEIPEENIYGYPPATGMKLSSAKIERLGWRAEYGMEEMYRRMISYLRETNDGCGRRPEAEERQNRRGGNE